MSSRDMATDEQKAGRAAASKTDLDANSSSYIRDNILRIEAENGIVAVEGQHGACPKCAGTRTTNYQLQMDSGDEPMTVFVNCLQCGHQWRIN
jgi:DNA-directed RNA polymerase subunit M/transcription elongation factor TFIIS